ncbi:DEAD-box helicase, probable [Ostreococcus lucimarinus CCE9901]|uniref:ATP-dependent RNA helicase n=1 Tax=Ostreococcus lucimarinus (strain CCE9901) TaxID=436017 RepID=A4RT37_OSTLU|nr:DEAD-box helicase, probable [Ostreococcus lucimarinus CCE9901]ABO94434.1 DEAD-box helicase, probable [Ostreococcus lucimarinus CCE9901]|tara:strand:+ start:5581 stop:6921 length:1341 start_codon:yes stop_codon:yes gene_type:complete|eukprot:XP_001416141.1 DEAD-box helicase, probable [Ostreococcus lucimarinus CCE9901]
MRAFVSGEKLRKRNGHDMNGECPRQITPVSPLDHRLYATLARGQLHSLLPVQKQTLSRALAGSFERDLCVTAPTGSGKTLSYLLPVLQILSKRVSKAETVCLILVPSGDLSAQVCVAASELCKALHVQISIVGKSRNTTNSTKLVNKRYRRLLAQNRQRMYQCCITRQFARHNSLDVPSQILVASPGRFAAHRTSILKKLKLLVIDEADRMLQQSYQNWLVTLDYEMCARTRQCRRLTVGERNSERLQLIFCSATLQSSCLQRVGAFALDRINAYDSVCPLLPITLSEYAIVAEHTDKFDALVSLLEFFKGEKVIVFSASVYRARHILQRLNKLENLPCFEYSSDANLRRRASTLQNFQRCQGGVLVASDAAARGLHIDAVSAVISFDAPEHFETYLHRAGRTARAGKTGKCITICSTAREAQTFIKRVQRHVPILLSTELQGSTI